ncbi:hypothetical protein [Sphingomonas sp.]|uniref:hypothetical protein n=1 Tax=Sphingomonas sp. TaxID=28214 RepID=UPI001EB1EEC6|nr:hypothetical protein [Sphingomonas sp.]MBX3593099.1 hypothetical protein [Sphingomonas sp.]
MLSPTVPRDLDAYRVQRHFADHRAMTAGTAIEYVPAGPRERAAFDRLLATGVIRQTSPAHYWFDLDRMGSARRRRLRNPKLPVAVALGVILAILAIWVLRS